MHVRRTNLVGWRPFTVEPRGSFRKIPKGGGGGGKSTSEDILGGHAYSELYLKSAKGGQMPPPPK